MTNNKILVVDDELKIAGVVRDFLVRDNFDVTLASDGAQVSELVQALNPALVVLDIMLPGMNGMDILRNLRSHSSVPIIMLTARIDEYDRLEGFKAGADDYVCKPFSPAELVARVHSVLRRTTSSDYDVFDENVVTYRGIKLDTEQLSCVINGEPISLTRIEFRLLRGMLAKPGNICSRYQLMRMAYDDHRVVSDRTIDSHVSHLRRKLTKAFNGEVIVHSRYGVGYKIE
jgi:two-component system response regulator BaeR